MHLNLPKILVKIMSNILAIKGKVLINYYINKKYERLPIMSKLEKSEKLL